MISTNLIPYPGFEKFTENIDFYIKMFLDGKVIAFRGANCPAEEQEKIMTILGDKLGWWPNSSNNLNSSEYKSPFYYETHSKSMNNTNTTDKNSLMLGWHLEHVGKLDVKYCGACWCMNLFKCEPDAGRTFFVDTIKVLESLSKEDQEFLDRCYIKITPFGEEEAYEGINAPFYKFLQKHWVLNRLVPRPVLMSSHKTELKMFGESMPTEQEKEKFNKLFDYIVDQVNNNEEIRIVHSWEEGDMLILDVFRLAHAVTGGFVEGERKLDGIFGKVYLSS